MWGCKSVQHKSMLYAFLEPLFSSWAFLLRAAQKRRHSVDTATCGVQYVVTVWTLQHVAFSTSSQCGHCNMWRSVRRPSVDTATCGVQYVVPVWTLQHVAFST
jgi:hypothetical protein